MTIRCSSDTDLLTAAKLRFWWAMPNSDHFRHARVEEQRQIRAGDDQDDEGVMTRMPKE
jgi:hypothetical protein